jgi:hypothetical protein
MSLKTSVLNYADFNYGQTRNILIGYQKNQTHS